jgi:hypothetical protein
MAVFIRERACIELFELRRRGVLRKPKPDEP